MPKKAPAPPVVEEEEEVTCPVCGKPVGLEVTACPYCGAEFESEEEEAAEEKPAEEEEAAPKAVKAEPEAAVGDEDSAECPVCGKLVSLSVSACPYCGAEFEEEEVEEVIEVEEKAPEAELAEEAETAEEAEQPTVARARKEEVEVEEEVGVSEADISTSRPSPLVDLKVIGVSLIILGIIGSQISVMIDWYWTWVPPIENNLLMFIAIPIVVSVLGIAVFMLMRRRSAAGKKVSKSLPSVSMSILIFGILAVIMVAMWKPINNALQNSSIGVAGAFFAVLVVGILVVFMGARMTARATA